ncbi:MAG TPA: DUF4157 domain-containing protein [Kofleriaceae bacterium]
MSVEQKAQDAGRTSGAAQADGVTVHERTLPEAFARRRTSTTLPHLEQIRRLLGRHDVRCVRAHVGGPAAEAARALGAQAYTNVNRAAFAELPYHWLMRCSSRVTATRAYQTWRQPSDTFAQFTHQADIRPNEIVIRVH